MKALERALRIARKPKAGGGPLVDDGVPALLQEAMLTQQTPPPIPQPAPTPAPAMMPTMDEYGNQFMTQSDPSQNYRVPFKAPNSAAATAAPIHYIEDEWGNAHEVPAGTPGARQSAPGMSLKDGKFYNESAPVGILGKMLGSIGWNTGGTGVGSRSARATPQSSEAWDTPGGARANTPWGTAVQNTVAGMSPGYIADSLQRTVELPEEVREGKVAPDDVMRNIEFLANTTGIGGVAAHASGETVGAAGSFGGQLHPKADHAALQIAKKMTEDGVPPDLVRQQTGWFQDANDGKWRFKLGNIEGQAPVDPMTARAIGMQQGYDFNDTMHHATTHDLKGAFRDPRDPANWATEVNPVGYQRESYHGPGIYMTNSLQDATRGYLAGGPDLENRIGMRAERLVGEGMDYFDAMEQARAELQGETPTVYNLVARPTNPVHVNVPNYERPNPSRPQFGGQRQGPPPKAPETHFDYDSGYNPETDGAPTGSGIQLLTETEKALNKSGVARNDATAALGDLEGEMMNNQGLTASQYERLLRNHDRLYELHANRDERLPYLGTGDMLQDIYRNMGYDAIKHHNADRTFNTMSGRMAPNTTHTTMWEPEKIRSVDAQFDPAKKNMNGLFFSNADEKTGQAVAAGVRNREIDQMGFYSPSLEAAKALPQQSGTVQQMRSMLLKNGGKDKELAATGFDQAFPDPNAKVTRQQIEDFLRQNRVQLGQTSYGERKPFFSSDVPPEVHDAMRELGYLGFDNPGQAWGALRSHRDWAQRWDIDPSRGGADKILYDYLQANPSYDEGVQGRARFEQYATPGGENYRENILTLPNERAKALEEMQKFAVETAKKYPGDSFGISHWTPEEVAKYKALQAAWENTQPSYTSSHWPGVDNPVLHTRTKDFPNPEGKTRLIDESQSDWAQRGRDQGINDPDIANKVANARAVYEDSKNRLWDAMEQITPMARQWRETNSNSPSSVARYQLENQHEIAAKATPEQRANLAALAAENDQLFNNFLDLRSKASAQKGVPNAPFIGNTSDWTDLGIKKSLIDAARDPDVNRIAWTPGEVQNKRYGLEHHVDSIDVYPAAQGGNGRVIVKMKDGNRVPMVLKPDGTVESTYAEINGKPLSEVVGNDVAQRVLAQTTPNTIRGIDLAIGGEGQKGYYNKIYPGRTQEVMKKAGLGKPEFGNVPMEQETLIGHRNGRLEMQGSPFSNYPSYAFTPEMRQKILNEGLSLFNKGDPYASAVLGAIGRAGEENGVGRAIGDKAAQGHGSPEAGVSGRGQLPGGSGGVSPSDRTANPYARIPGIPETAKIPGYGEVEANPIPWVVDAANSYSKKAGIEHQLPEAFGPLDRERAARIAQAFEDMRHDPTNPEVRRAYEAMADETLAQYKALKDQGANYYFNNGTDPYAKSPAMGYPELRDKRSLSIFPTQEGFGTGEQAAAAIENNPLLKKTGEKFGDKEATVNDLFRAVHDSFGHFGFGNPFFRDAGEERAWMLHSGMYGPEARKAMTSETRGQNSWLNAGPHAEHNRTASGADTVYAPQKTGLLPDWVVNEGANGISRPEYEALQRAANIAKRRGTLFSNADDQMSLPLAELGREGVEQKSAAPAPAPAPQVPAKPPKPIVPRDLNPEDQGFYSQQIEALKTIPMKSGNAQQWANALKKAGVKDEELKWTGMGDWLKSKGNEKIPAEEVRQYAEENKVIPNTERYVNEKGDSDGYTDDEVWERAHESAYESDLEHYRNDRLSVDLDTEYMREFKDNHSIEHEPDILDPDKPYVIHDGETKNNDIVGRFATEKEAEEALDRMAEDSARENDKWAVFDDGDHVRSYDSESSAERGLNDIAHQYANDADPSDQGSIDDWREWLDMPEKSDSRTIGYLDDRPEGGENYTERVMDTPRSALQRQGSEGFSDTHIDWPQENIPGWLLTEDYKDKLTGKKVHFVHEAQSDWSQKAIDQGFKSRDQAALDQAYREYQDAIQAEGLAKEAAPFAAKDGTYYKMGEEDKYTANRHYRTVREYEGLVSREQAYVKKDLENVQEMEKRIAELKTNLTSQNAVPEALERQIRYTEDQLAGYRRQYESDLADVASAQARLDDTMREQQEFMAQFPQVPAEQAEPLIAAHQQAKLRRDEARTKHEALRRGIERGPWINDVPEVTKLLMKRGLIDAANEGADYFSWSAPEMVSSRWGERGYTEPLYGKMIPNTALKLAREHDPNVKMDQVLVGDARKQEPRGYFDLNQYYPAGGEPPPQGELFAQDNPWLGKAGPLEAWHNKPIKEIAYGPEGYRNMGPGRYKMIDENGRETVGFYNREAAEEAMRQINESLAKDEAEKSKNKGNALAIPLSPQMRESIKKRGFSAFLNPDSRIGALLSRMTGQKPQESEQEPEDDLPDYVEPAAKRRIQKGRRH